MSYFDTDTIRNLYLFGIVLKDTEGKDFPDELLQTYLDSAIAWAEKELGVVIHPREEEETHDFHIRDYQNWGYLQLYRKPIIEVESLTMYFGSQQVMTIPKDWLKIDPISGQIQLFPASGSTTGGPILTANGSLFLPLTQGRLDFAPQLWKVKYKAGMTLPEKGENQIYRKYNLHPDLKEIIYKKAANSILTVWGDLILGAGIASQAISIDGASQSVNTTQSAMYGAASARIQQYEADIDKLLSSLQRYYVGINVTVV